MFDTAPSPHPVHHYQLINLWPAQVLLFSPLGVLQALKPGSARQGYDQDTLLAMRILAKALGHCAQTSPLKGQIPR